MPERSFLQAMLFFAWSTEDASLHYYKGSQDILSAQPGFVKSSWIGGAKVDDNVRGFNQGLFGYDNDDGDYDDDDNDVDAI